jgi:hypothetical protein
MITNTIIPGIINSCRIKLAEGGCTGGSEASLAADFWESSGGESEWDMGGVAETEGTPGKPSAGTIRWPRAIIYEARIAVA